MKSEFKMSEWTDGESDFILNIRIDRDWEAGTVKISQPAAISKLAAKFQLDDITKRSARIRVHKTPSTRRIYKISLLDGHGLSSLCGVYFLRLSFTRFSTSFFYQTIIFFRSTFYFSAVTFIIQHDTATL